jgi:hypothetical protein
MAALVSSSVAISMNPKPRDWPVNLFVTTRTDSADRTLKRERSIVALLPYMATRRRKPSSPCVLLLKSDEVPWTRGRKGRAKGARNAAT